MIDLYRDTLIVSAASLDDPSVFSPACVFFTALGHDWDKLDPDLPKYATEAPSDAKLRGQNVCVVPDDGFEPPTIRLQGGRSTN